MKPSEIQDLLDALLDGVIVVDGDGCVRELNAEACRILETSAEKARSQSIEQLLGPEHPVCALADQVRSSRRAAIVDDIHIDSRHGPDIRGDVAVSPLGDHREPGGVVITR